MTIRTTALNGTDWSDGEVLYAADQNDTIKAVVGLVPIGSVIAWLKSYPNTPTLDPHFVECNGQTLSDSESPYNGQVIPNLNGSSGTKRFLRGSTTSGGTGGTEVHNHQWAKRLYTIWNGGASYTDKNSCTYDSAGNENTTSWESIDDFYTNNAGTLPSYYEVVWIMRIK